MRNLPTPTTDAVGVFDGIVSDKTKDIPKRLKRIRPLIKKAYKNYFSNAAKLENINPVGIKGVCQDALLHAYNNATKTLKTLRDDLYNPEDVEDFDECPYCGINEPRTLDHYLPKEDFPEFSILPINLIPICHVCNSGYKGVKFLSPANTRLFLNSYFDTFPIFDFISVDVHVASDIEIEFGCTTYVGNPYFSEIFANHFSELGLRKRFLAKSAAEISRKRTSLNRIFSVNRSYSDVAHELSIEAHDLRGSLSGNHWKVALYQALSASKDFCNGGFMKKVKRK